ncbi:MAG: Bro-N domain-containing protein [Bacilli bacterium]|nr:Bro-N domain-containing protein [Bacilli bacterium]
MKNNKLETISNLFEGQEIRSIWDKEKEEYYFSVVDVISALTDATIPKRYWSDLKRELINEGSQLYEKIVQLKLKSSKDGKNYLTDTLDTEGIFRLIESVPSPKAEPFKLWLAKLGRQKVDEIFDPSKGIDEMIDFYLKKGYTLEWIEARIKAIIDRKRLTKVWNDGGVKEGKEYAMLTNAIYKEWSGMTASEYKAFKGIRKENLRDNMSRIEVLLTDLGELAAHDIAEEEHPQGFRENVKAAKRGGKVAKDARNSYEKATKKSAISKNNSLKYKYIDENNKIEKR